MKVVCKEDGEGRVWWGGEGVVGRVWRGGCGREGVVGKVWVCTHVWLLQAFSSAVMKCVE